MACVLDDDILDSFQFKLRVDAPVFVPNAHSKLLNVAPVTIQDAASSVREDAEDSFISQDDESSDDKRVDRRVDAGAIRASSYRIEKDKKKAALPVDRVLAAAKLGLPKAQGEMAARYYLGTDGVEENKVEALKWWELAAAQGCTTSMFNIGIMYEDLGVESDLAAALSWYKKSALVQINE